MSPLPLPSFQFFMSRGLAWSHHPIPQPPLQPLPNRFYCIDPARALVTLTSSCPCHYCADHLQSIDLRFLEMGFGRRLANHVRNPTGNHFNGDNLLECDQAVLKELGIKKIGDRVRIFVAIKGLRTKAYAKQRRRNRVGSSCIRALPLSHF